MRVTQPVCSATMVRPAKVTLALLLSIFNTIAVGVLIYLTLFNTTTEPNKASNSKSNDWNLPHGQPIFALGRLQPKSGVVNVFGPPGERITEVKVSVGSVVRKDQVLFGFSGETERQLGLETLKKQVEEAEKLKDSAHRSKQAKRAEIEAEIKRGRAELEAQLAGLDAKVEASKLQQNRAATELARLETIRSRGATISEMDFLEIKTLADQAVVELKALETQKRLAEEQARAAEAAARAKIQSFEAETDRAIAQIPLESARAGLAVAQAKAQAATITAPFDGSIVKLAAKPGDTVANMPLAQIADTSKMLVIAEVYESELPALRRALENGTKTVSVAIDTRGIISAKPLKGTVTLAGLSGMVARNTVFALDPRGDTDRRVIEVEVELDQDSSDAAANWIGLQVRVEFLLKASTVATPPVPQS